MAALPDARCEGTVRVRDGRSVGFAEWGVPEGRPVVAFHGGPGSRFMALGCEEQAADFGLRIVCLERPGFGLSDFAPARSLISWVEDVSDATQALAVERFAAVGVSAGAPYALACGARLPSVVSRVVVAGGVVPPQFSPDDPFTDLVLRDGGAAQTAARRHFEAIAADVDASVAAMAAGAGPDHAVYSRPDVQNRFRRTRHEAFRAGTDGAVLDLMLLHQAWGFDLHDILVPTRWWHGSRDPIAPIAAVREATAGIRDLELTVCEGEGHATGFTRGAEILDALARTD